MKPKANSSNQSLQFNENRKWNSKESLHAKIEYQLHMHISSLVTGPLTRWKSVIRKGNFEVVVISTLFVYE